MANADYTVLTGAFGFCPTALIPLAVPLQAAATSVAIGTISSPIPNPIRVGMGAMINTEIVAVESFSGNNLVLLRGCADTIPMSHPAGSRIWFFDDSIGRVPAEYAAAGTVSVKPLVRTSSAMVPVESSPPIGVTFNQRIGRPYPPGNVQANSQPWTTSGIVIASGTPLSLSWAHRNRITQGDLLVPHTAGSITPEAGTTYRMRVFQASNNANVATYTTTAASFVYTGGQATLDFGSPSSPTAGYILLESLRDGLASMMNYRIDFTIQPTSLITQSQSVNYTFDARPVAAQSVNYTVS